MQKTYWTQDRIVWWIIGLGITAVLVWLVRYLSSVLLPFFLACFFAYMLQPLVAFNQKWTKLKGRTLPSILSLIEVVAVIAVIVFIFLPTVINETNTLGAIIKEVQTGKRPIPEHLLPVIEIVDKYAHPDQLKALLDDLHLQTIINKGTSLLSQGIEVLEDLISWILCVIYVIFILIDYPQIAEGFKLIFPAKWRPKALEVVHDVKQNMNSYFRGQGVVALCACVLYCIGFSIVGLPLAIPMGILVGILYMIPYFQYITLVPVAIICFIYSLGGSSEFLPMLGKCGLVYVVSQSICDYLITPHIMGKEMGMNPAIILLSLSVWGSLLGIIGMIIALPVSALLMTYYKKYISDRE